MVKILIITGLILYVLYKIGSFFFRAGAASQQFRNQGNPSHFKKSDKNAKGPTIKGGEYIDYEEIK
ncbi:MAG TPA: hypothetical protein VD927_18080 [Chryseosolibacter sp.]|nr:hypothetical protein [Chryseosolibacter sp.]